MENRRPAVRSKETQARAPRAEAALKSVSRLLAGFGVALSLEASALAGENEWETRDQAIADALAVDLSDQARIISDGNLRSIDHANKRASEISEHDWERKDQDKFIASLEQLMRLRVEVRPEYEQTADHILIGNGMEDNGDFIDMSEVRFQEYANIIAALPYYTQVHFFSDVQSQVFMSWAEQARPDILDGIASDNHGLHFANNGRTRWAQDIGEIVMDDGKATVLTSEYKLANDVSSINEAEVPFMLDGGDVTPAGRHVLVGNNVVDFMRGQYAHQGLSVETPQLQTHLEAIFDRPVLLMESPYGFLINMFHVDQYVLPVDNNTMVSIDYDFNTSDVPIIEGMVRKIVEEFRQTDQDIVNNMTSKQAALSYDLTPEKYNRIYNRLLYERIILARKSAAQLNYAHDTLSQNGYEVVEIPVGVDRVLDAQSYLNGTMYRRNDQTHFIMPTFGNETEAQRVQGQLEQAGLIVHPVADHFSEDLGNIHCVTNVW